MSFDFYKPKGSSDSRNGIEHEPFGFLTSFTSGSSSHATTATTTTNNNNSSVDNNTSSGGNSTEGIGGTFSVYLDNFSRRARGMFTDEPPENETLLELPQEQGYAESIGELLQLTYTQRLAAFFMTLGMGLVFILFAASTGAAMILVAPKKFAFFLTVGNIFCLLSTTFLVGASYQLRMMFSAHRFQAALLYCTSVFLTIYFSVIRPFGLACLVLAVIQVACLLWYCLSFVPFARRTIQLVLSSGWAGMIVLRRGFNSIMNAF